MAAEVAAKYNIKPLAVISGMGKGGCAPELMGESPVPAVVDMMKKTGHKIPDYNRIEVSELWQKAQQFFFWCRFAILRYFIAVERSFCRSVYCLRAGFEPQP